jgi:hypothetical protein
MGTKLMVRRLNGREVQHMRRLGVAIIGAGLFLSLGHVSFSQTPAMVALQQYLDEDCGVRAKKETTKLETLLTLKEDASVQNELALLLQFGLRKDGEMLNRVRTSLEEQWDKYPVTFKDKDIEKTAVRPEAIRMAAIKRPSSKDFYVDLHLAQIERKYSDKSAVALAAFESKGSTEASTALNQASMTGDQRLKTLIERARKKF